jgi:hypothetical protein
VSSHRIVRVMGCKPNTGATSRVSDKWHSFIESTITHSPKLDMPAKLFQFDCLIAIVLEIQGLRG